MEIDIVNVGSSAGLTAIMLGEADVAGIHLFDEENNRYNLPFLKKYWIEDRAVLIKGYQREYGFIISKTKSKMIKKIEDLLLKNVKFVNRTLGSGTRTIFDIKLKKLANSRGVEVNQIKTKIKGYGNELKSHVAVAEAVKKGIADVSIGSKAFANKFGLDFVSLGNEDFDFVVEKKRLDKSAVKTFLSALKSDEFKKNLGKESFGISYNDRIGEIIPPN